MPSKKPTQKSIKNAEIHIGNLPSALYPEGMNPEVEKIFCIYIDSEILKTPNGIPITHKDRSPLRELATELEFMDHLDVQQISLYSLCCSQIDFMEKGDGTFSEEVLREGLLNDPALKTCAGPEQIDQMKYMHLVAGFLSRYNIRYPNLAQIPLGKTGLELARNSPLAQDDDPISDDFYTLENDENFNRLVKTMHSLHQRLNVHQRTVFVVSGAILGSFTLSLMLALQSLSPRELAMIYMMANGNSGKVWGETNRKKEREYFEKIQKITECITRYLELFQSKPSKSELIIQKGEGKLVEFKSTLRWSLKGNCVDAALEHEALKTIVAFLNSDGGTLLVGVEDNGNVLGIEPDGFKNEDKYLLHFSGLFNERIGKKFADLVRWDLDPCKGKKVLLVKCQPSPGAVFLITDKQEEFYIRTGPSSVKLKSSEILEYTESRRIRLQDSK